MKQFKSLILSSYLVLSNLSASNLEECLNFPIAVDFSLAGDTWRSLPEGSWEDNTGFFTSLNVGLPIPYLSSYGFGWQLGGSFGVYDLSGRGSADGRVKSTQQQTFLTTSIFRRTPCDSGFNFAIAFDEMLNKNFGVYALDPSLGQLRLEASYLIQGCNEWGIWGTLNTNTAHEIEGITPTTFQAISQINLFWRHYFENCSQTTVWVGVPYKNGLMFPSKSPGEFIIGASFKVPLTYEWSIEGHAAYMQPRHLSGVYESRDSASNICLAITYSFGNSCTEDETLDFSPYLPLGNNSNFLVDTNHNF